jgi:hypothetical protein
MLVKLYKGPYANHFHDIAWAESFPLPEVGDFISVEHDYEEYEFKVCARKFNPDEGSIYLYEH